MVSGESIMRAVSIAKFNKARGECNTPAGGGQRQDKPCQDLCSFPLAKVRMGGGTMWVKLELWERG